MALTKDSGVSAQFNRRALLKLAPALAVVPAAALSGEVLPPVSETPVEALFREWEIAHADLISDRWDDATEDEQEAICGRVSDIAYRMMELPSRSARDFAMKVTAYTVFGENGLPDEGQDRALWAEARALVAA
ncbi:hypothetical protein PE067_09405 [Paracoccus sp. DMF-8]|uniref:hypothetical protein n=1 Tax=Paracoccus sp. DMF-8 TaxID=3019445 RepID=UPI0023E887E9|nr:hypothetical protein [Paracoccus sp. DMF-8]MDF3606335.1 hypothetical protein [Paracoccus sp. DMF-8]